MNDLVIITARKNSKRLKNKNLKYLGRKTLIERTLIFAKKISSRNFIYLSTDSKKILKIGKRHKVFCPGLRPKFISNDKSTSADVCLYSVKTFEKKNKIKIDNIILLQPTSPFRSVFFYKKTMKIFKKNFNPTYSVSPLLDNKIIYRKNKTLKFTEKILNHYVVNGNLYFIKVEDLKKNKNFFSKKFNISITNSKKLSLDIDTIYDLENAKLMIK